MVPIVERLCHSNNQEYKIDSDISTLRDIVAAHVFPSTKVIDVLKDVIFSSQHEGAMIECCKLFCQVENPFPTNSHLDAFIEMLDLLPSSPAVAVEVRSHVLHALQRFLVAKAECGVEYLVEQTPMLDKLTTILVLDDDGSNSNEVDKTNALDIIRHLVRNPRYSTTVCHRHNKLIEAIVNIVVVDHDHQDGPGPASVTTNKHSRRARFYALECLLCLLNNTDYEDVARYFQPMSERLVPWLLDFLNSTTSSCDKFKEQLRSATEKLVEYEYCIKSCRERLQHTCTP